MNKTKILLIEDDKEISRLTSMYLDVEGYQVQAIEDGLLAIETIRDFNPDCIILDLMLPGLSGIDICKKAREFYQGAILILTACDDDMSEVSLLKLGADDYLVKPLKPHILVARIEALLRRISNNNDAKQVPSDDLSIDHHQRMVSYKGESLNLTSAEYEMLKILHEKAGSIVSREECCQALRGIDYDLSNRSIDMRISGLRRKLGDNMMPYQVIATIRNKGYMLINE